MGDLLRQHAAGDDWHSGLAAGQACHGRPEPPEREESRPLRQFRSLPYRALAARTPSMPLTFEVPEVLLALTCGARA